MTEEDLKKREIEFSENSWGHSRRAVILALSNCISGIISTENIANEMAVYSWKQRLESALASVGEMLKELENIKRLRAELGHEVDQ